MIIVQLGEVLAELLNENNLNTEDFGKVKEILEKLRTIALDALEKKSSGDLSQLLVIVQTISFEEIMQSAQQWSKWSGCLDNGFRQRKRIGDDGLVTIEKQVCYPKFNATFTRTPRGGPRFALPKTSSEAYNMDFKLISDCSKSQK